MTKRELLNTYLAWSGGKFPQDQPTHIHDQFEAYLEHSGPEEWEDHRVLIRQWLAEGLSPSLIGLSLVDRSPVPRDEEPEEDLDVDPHDEHPMFGGYGPV